MRLKQNRLQFAITREDPQIEEFIVKKLSKPQAKILLIGSGGCTAFHLQSQFSDLQITLIEPNLSQVSLIDLKLNILNSKITLKERASYFNVGNEFSNSLVSGGNFESLFKQLREFIFEFILDKDKVYQIFKESKDADSLVREIICHPYWKVAFDLCFHDSLLKTMFGSEAIQHSIAGSYPKYFAQVLEAGLIKKERRQNIYLQHIFLGHYLAESYPDYLNAKPSCFHKMRVILSFIQDIKDFSEFDIVSLSNVFDWMDEDNIEIVAKNLCETLNPMAHIIYRQLNHSKDFQLLFQPDFQFDNDLENYLLEIDKSLFYSKINIGVRKC